jgi:hypothetical protein
MFSNLAYAEVKAPTVEKSALENKISILEDKFIQYDKNFDRIVNNQRDVFSTAIFVVLAITAALLGAGWFNNNYLIKHNINKATDDLRKEFANKIKEVNLEIKEFTETRFKKIENDYSCRFAELEALNNNAVGRIYQQSDHFTSALWYARGLRESVKCKILDDDWIKLQIKNVSSQLEKSESINKPEWIAELFDIIKIIPEEKFKSEKESLQKILKDKIGKTTPS